MSDIHQDDKDKLIQGHEYDGIRELNNPLPGWWLFTFYITIVFAVGYYGYYELLGGPSQDEQLAVAMQEIQQQQSSVSEPAPSDDGPIDVGALIADKEKMAMASQAYASRCLACHGAKGEGLIGPNLADKYWIHSKGDIAGILYAIRVGFPEKGMPPWGDIIPKEEHAPLAAYVISLQGTNPPNPKAPQGEPVE